MPRKQPHARPATHRPSPAVEQAWQGRDAAEHPTVPVRWLLWAIGLVIVAAGVCAWAVLCLMFWQGSWQLLYHPSAAVTRTPASAGLAYSDIGFATTGTGMPRLKGWLIPANPSSTFSRYTVLYLHDATGNLGDTVGDLVRLHTAGLNILAFDYRGYGQSQFIHPSESRWREDADSALEYLTGTRHIPARSILLVGKGLGATLALQIAAAHPGLAGVVLEEPRTSAMQAIFNDPRARLVPAHVLVKDRWRVDAPAASLRIPSLWIYLAQDQRATSAAEAPDIFTQASGPKSLLQIPSGDGTQSAYTDALDGWLKTLQAAVN
ncbi:MAG TPA: alpha/beta fold hydrolase [Terracidiphilus sp.]|nr:alpha/beta fold hydrolase [Terracidiphilus sp.]